MANRLKNGFAPASALRVLRSARLFSLRVEDIFQVPEDAVHASGKSGATT